MINTAVHTMLEDYARMLTVVHSGVAVVWSAFLIPTDPAAIGMVILFLAAAIRSLGPFGTSWWSPLFTTAVFAGLVTMASVHWGQAADVVLPISVLILLCMKLTGEATERQRIQE